MSENSNEDPTQTGELGPMPTPQIEPAEESPGGPDAVPAPAEVIAADLDPEKNPATDDSPEIVRESLEEGEDTDTEATRSETGTESDGEAGDAESPA